MQNSVNIIGAGLAGCEAAWQLAERGIEVTLYEMKPHTFSPAHSSPDFAELVCSNSFRSDDPLNAAGLLKEEMRSLSSLIIEAADMCRVPAGKALATDRCNFSAFITKRIESHSKIKIIREEVDSLDHFINRNEKEYTVVASGPLTSDNLSESIAKIIGSEYLYFYDSVAPVVEASSIDFSKGFKASRYGYGGDDYWNFPLTQSEYEDFLLDIVTAEKTALHNFEDPHFFEGCLPIEVMAVRGYETLRYGPMKPFGLKNPENKREPYAVVQLRQENLERSMYNLVGFQTRLTWNEQRRIFSKLPGFEMAEFVRLGVIHRNTYLQSPRLLDEKLSLISMPRLFFAGQMTGVEGYIESAATGLWCGLYLGRLICGRRINRPDSTTAIGSLIWHVANPNHRNFQPMNVNFGLMPIIKENIPKKERKIRMVERARKDFESWQSNL